MSRTSTPRQVNIHETKTHLSKLLARVEAGEEIVIARAGKPIAKIIRLSGRRARPKPGFMKRLGIKIPEEFYEPMTEAEIDEFEGPIEP